MFPDHILAEIDCRSIAITRISSFGAGHVLIPYSDAEGV